jgi:hypothetical protein
MRSCLFKRLQKPRPPTGWDGHTARDKRSTPLGYGTLPMPLISDGQDVLSNKLDDLLTCLKEPWRQPAFEWQQIVWELRGQEQIGHLKKKRKA